MKHFSKLQTEEIIGLIEIRQDTISVDKDSADAFETEERLTVLRDKLLSNSTNFLKEEAIWIIVELNNRQDIGFYNDATIHQAQVFANSIECAIDKLCEAHGLNKCEIRKRIENFSNVYDHYND